MKDTSYRATVETLDALRFAWMSHASRRPGGPPINRRGWADCVEWLSKLARESDALAQVVRAIGLPPLYQTAGEAAAYIYRQAFETMTKPYDDVIGRSGPDAGRPSSHRRDWTLAEKILVLAYLSRATFAWSATAPGYGWAITELAQEERVRIPAWATGRS